MEDTGDEREPSVIDMVDGMWLESQVAARLAGSGGPVLWIRPGPNERGAAVADLAAAAWSARPVPGADVAAATLVVAGSRATVAGDASWPGAEIVLVEEAAQEAGRRRRWSRREADGHESDVAARILQVSGGRPAMTLGLLEAGSHGMRPSLEDLLARVATPNQMVLACVSRVVATLDESRRDALLLAARVGYAHESLRSLGPCLEEIKRQPWWEEMSGGWFRVALPWRRALRAWPAPATQAHAARVARLVGELEQLGALPEAVDVGLRSGLPDLAAQVLMDWFESPASERVIEAAAWLPRPSTFLTRYPVLASAATAVRRGDTDPGPSDVATAVLETADALSDGRLLEAAVRARTARSLARKLGDPHATADARRLLWATRAVESRRSPRGRVRTMLWAAGLAASVAARGYDLMADRPVPRARIRARAPSPRASASGPDRPRPGLHRLEARLLGPFEVAVDGRRLHDWSGMLGRSLLAYLLWRHPQPASRDVVLAEFWPDVPAKSARNRLHVTLHDLRKDLARIVAVPVVLHRYSAYVLNPEFDVVTDVAETARLWETAVSAGTDNAATSTALEQMLALHEGSFAEGCTYDEWALGEREFQHLRKLEAMLRLARSYLEGGELAACIDIGRRLLMMDNCHEEAHRILMRAHSRLGQHHLALRQYEQCSRELRVELGMAPDVATLDLVEAIRQRRVV